MPDAGRQILDLFAEALECGSAAEQAAYLERACRGDAAARARVEALLRAHREAGPFLRSDTAATLDDRPATEAAGTVVGPYKLLQQIGEGGMGAVFMAEQEQPVRRKVALKIIKPGMDSGQVLARFEAERQALALMDHPNIAHVFDAGTTEGGLPYFVMELVKGVPITRYCDERRLTPRERLELFVPVCQAVQHAHQKGIIHRDLKPSNVLVALYDGSPVSKVIDFGVAKATGPKLTERTLFTEFGQVVGTLEYMSPEQAELNQLDIDTRSDVYSLGVLLYELLTGATPLRHMRATEAPLLEALRVIREEEPAAPSKCLSTTEELPAIAAKRGLEPRKLSGVVRGELDWIVMKCLEKDRNRRYESANSLARDVERYLRDEPVQACPPSAWYRLRKFARRSKAGLGVSGLVLFFVVLIGSGAGWAVRDRAAREADLAQDQAARQARLDREIEHALDEATRAREQALTLTDNPFRWEAALAETGSGLKRAQGLAAQDEAAVEPAVRGRLQALQALLDADKADRRFAARFDEIRLEQSGLHLATSQFKVEIALPALKEAFQRHYQIEFVATPAEQAVTLIRRRPKPVQDVLVAALETCLDIVPKDVRPARSWLAAVLDGADTGPWRRRAQQAIRASDWKALEQVIEEAAAARQPPSLLLRLVWKIPYYSPTCLAVARRIRQVYPGDFWANHDLANILHFGHSQPEEAIRYYTAALALRPHNPGTCVELGRALERAGDPDGAIGAYREALDWHPDCVVAHEGLGRALESKGDPDGAIAELRQLIGSGYEAQGRFLVGNVLLHTGHREAAIASYRKAIELNPNLGEAHYNLGIALSEKKECQDAATESYRNAITCDRRTIELNPEDNWARNDLAWFLATCAYVQLREPAEAVKLAQKNVELAPMIGEFWKTLGVAHYSAGSCQETIAALEKAMELRNGGDSNDWFVLAMACWRLGEQDKARQWFDKAVQWMDKNRPNSRDLGRVRAEAAKLLKVEAKEK
jgi:serine/threonine protein kinase/Flp pilus assembly protein TadD